jgi:cytochrome c oxidase cbb3-type subunit 2|tara:strand:+ start:5059 stop:5775 length:717 start_codon:yes stop_codon:yes gene_type:complete
MKSLPLLFLGIFFTLAFSWTGIILTTYFQFEDSGSNAPATATFVDAEGNEIVGPTYKLPSGQIVDGENNPEVGLEMFPAALSGSAQRGLAVYEKLGCLYCHSQQVRRQGFGSDFERGWGSRQSVARDYIFFDRVMLGTMRTGPDLSNVGLRYTELWQHQHLFSPQSLNGWSIMPSYAFLYEIQPIGLSGPSGNAINLLDSWEISADHEVVPTRDATDLVAYLLSLNQNYELPEVKFSD